MDKINNVKPNINILQPATNQHEMGLLSHLRAEEAVLTSECHHGPIRHLADHQPRS